MLFDTQTITASTYIACQRLLSPWFLEAAIAFLMVRIVSIINIMFGVRLLYCLMNLEIYLPLLVVTETI
jgi:hypothetical protein